MSTPTLVIGDDFEIGVTLKSDAATFDMSGLAASARVVAADHLSVYTETVAQSELATGADWTNSLIIVAFSAAQTAVIDQDNQGPAFLEIQVAFPAKKTWFLPLFIVNGQIS